MTANLGHAVMASRQGVAVDPQDDYFIGPDDAPVAHPGGGMHPDINVGSRADVPDEDRLPPGADPQGPIHPLAFVALLVALLWGFGALSLLALVLGWIARRSIRDVHTPYRGDAVVRVANLLAIAGLVVAFVLYGLPRLLETRDEARTATELKSVLVDAGQAQIAHVADVGRYAATVEELAPYRTLDLDGAVLIVVTATPDTFCVEGRAGDTGPYHVTQADATRAIDGSCP